MKRRSWGPDVAAALDTTAQRSLTENEIGFFVSFIFLFLQGRINTSARPEWDQSAH